ENVVEAVQAWTRGRGVAAVFDPVGATTYETNLRLLAPRGYGVDDGELSGALPAIDLERVMEAGSIFVTKYGPRAGLVGPAQLAELISQALAMATTRPVTADIAGRFPLDDVADAYRALESSAPGKVLVLPWQGFPIERTLRWTTVAKPPLETPRLILRPVALEDVEQLQATFPQWEIVRLLSNEIPWPYPPDGALTYIRDVALPAIAAGTLWMWTVRLKSDP